jgi:hypothetical protein
VIVAKMSRLLENPYLHSFLLGAYPIVFLYVHNLEKVRLPQLVWPLVTVFGATFLLLILLRPLIRDAGKRGFVVSLFLIYFFSYGPLLGLDFNIRLSVRGNMLLAHEVVLFLVLTCLMGLAVFFLLRSRRDPLPWAQFLNITALVLISLQIGLAVKARVTDSPARATPQAEIRAGTIPSELPDIYYIVLDGYGRSDVLREYYDFDNQLFLGELRSRGFWVGEKSASNYMVTMASLVSALNFNYIQELFPGDPEHQDIPVESELLLESRAAFFLRGVGYQTVAFATGYWLTECLGADHYFRPGLFIDEFQNMVLNSTPIPYLLEVGKAPSYNQHRERILFALTKLADLSEIAGPKFVMAHLVCPHPPFIFGRNGEAVSPDRPFVWADGRHYIKAGGTRSEYVEGYRNQVDFLNGELLAAVNGILENSPTPPIIILQGDHGPGLRLDRRNFAASDLRERFGILNAIHLPSKDADTIPHDLAPVNNFRLVFDHVFDTGLGLIANRHYFNRAGEHFNFTEVSDRLESP